MRVVSIHGVELLDAYYRVTDNAAPKNWDARLGIEARKRLKQLDWLLLQVQQREVEHAQVMPSDPARAAAVVEEIELLTEAFYYLAFRARSVLQALPGLESFDPIGVRNVRNKLIEHPEGQDFRVLDQSFVFGADHGPVFRGMRFEHESPAWPDPGLYRNAKEFREKLHVLLLPYIARDREERETVT
ncbi:MAG: hypothetical protein QOH92_604 [Chloroflexota bacterium]|jgi:hypothetical protein|nr:hypothetical protein [Chloroflexota bacterium]